MGRRDEVLMCDKGCARLKGARLKGARDKGLGCKNFSHNSRRNK